MSAGGHFVKKCKHGTILTQCRCASKDKHVIIVDCPSRCPQKDDPSYNACLSVDHNEVNCLKAVVLRRIPVQKMCKPCRTRMKWQS